MFRAFYYSILAALSERLAGRTSFRAMRAARNLCAIKRARAEMSERKLFEDLRRQHVQYEDLVRELKRDCRLLLDYSLFDEGTKAEYLKKLDGMKL